MSLGHGTGIVRNGLIFHYDMSNTAKSWKGAPTTNISSKSIGGLNDITLIYVGIDDGWKKYSLSGTWNSGSYPYCLSISNATFTGGIAYSTRILIKTNTRSKFGAWGGINYTNDPNMVNSGVNSVVGIGYDRNGLEIQEWKRQGFIYSTIYANPTTNQPGYLVSMPVSNGTTFNPSTDFVWVKEIQIEQGSFCTPYVDGARTNTQTLIDLTKNVILTSTDLAYASNNTFSFNGASRITSLLSGSSLNVAYTRIVWVKPSVTSVEMKSAMLNQIGNNSDMAVGIENGYAAFHQYTKSNSGADGDYTFKGSTAVSLNTVYMIAVTVDRISTSNNIKIYLNGALDGTTSKVLTTATSASDYIIIGGPGVDSYSGSRMFYGDIYSAMYYNRVLTETEIKQNFEALRGRYGI